jgi:hypothetical protein
MSGIEKFRDFVGSGNIDTFVREESGGKVESLGKGFFGRVRPSGDTNRTVTESFRKALVKEYGEHVSQWVFTDYEDRMRNGKPLSGERIQKVINRAEVARQKDLTALRKVLPQIVTPLLETSLKKAGLEAPDMGGNEWRRLMTMVVDEICKNSKSGNSKELGDLSLQVDKFVEDNKSRIEEQLSEPLDLKTLIVEDYQRSPGLVISGQEPRDSLQQIWGYLSQPGNDSGVLILRTNDEGEMTLERKSSSQLSSLDEEQLKQQVHDTHTLLRKCWTASGRTTSSTSLTICRARRASRPPSSRARCWGSSIVTWRRTCPNSVRSRKSRHWAAAASAKPPW